jgi:hypothetical protein
MTRIGSTFAFRENCTKEVVLKGQQSQCSGKVVTVETVCEESVTIERICDHCGTQNRPMRRLKRRSN